MSASIGRKERLNSGLRPCLAEACAHAARQVAHLFVGFTPKREYVGVPAGDFDGGIRGAGDIDVDLMRLHLREAVLDRVESAVVVERLAARPFQPHHIEEFAGARVAFVLVSDGVAVAREFALLAAGNDVDRDAAGIERVEGGELPCEHGGRGETRTLRDEDAEPLCDARGVLADLQTVRQVGVEGEQRAVETSVFVGLADRLDIIAINNRTAARNDLGSFIIADEADEFDGHGRSLLRGSRYSAATATACA